MRCQTYILIAVIMLVINLLIKKENQRGAANAKYENFEICLPQTYKWIGLIAMTVFISIFIAMIVYPNDTAAIWIGLVFIGFALLGLSLVLASVNWRIFVSPDSFIYKTMFGRSYRYKYADVRWVRLSENLVIIKTTDKRFFVDPYAIGLDVILYNFDIHNIPMLYKYSPEKNYTTLMKQLWTLKDLGVSPKTENYGLLVCREFGYVTIIKNPYELVFYLMSVQKEAECEEDRYVSDDIYGFEIDYIEDENTYKEILKNIVRISKGEVGIEDIVIVSDTNNQKTDISFSLNDSNYNIDLMIYHEGFDMGLFDEINRVLDERGLDKRYCIYTLNETVFVLFNRKEKVQKINELVGTNFQ